MQPSPHRLCIAPMMEWTDRHCRFFLRLITRHARLYTEMVTSAAIMHGKAERLLVFDPAEHPVALQLGGSDPKDLAACARIGERFGYDEINLNVGCPSDKVQEGRFGACLMAEPALVAQGVRAMRDAVAVPVTVKTRIGIDEKDSYAELVHFIGTVAEAGCSTFIMHARKAWLQGLSPKENREVPPLRYDVVRQLQSDFPALEFVLNGGIVTAEQVDGHLAEFPGVMLGRAAYENPYLLAQADGRWFGETGAIPSRVDIVEAFRPYVASELSRGQRLHSVTRHILGLFQGVRGGRAWRRYLSENACKPGAGLEVLDGALQAVQGLAAAA
ncbi:MAG: tRNA dihydrouridine(20/20a) synthase DusA [Fibrobacteres bacterium]|nr:tRNA dihydrouridine(20/20a) synthase DusA [Fibrobacterota bacterium]